jgi:SAM-dependent methyltransferase
MPFEIDDLHYAYLQYRKFVSHNPHRYHERYIFPFFAGSYFAYRLVDVARVISIAYSISRKPTYVDIGCGYGDFLEKIREYLPNAVGIEKEGKIFYAFGRTKPNYIYSTAVEWMENQNYDLVFIGWMEPGVDFRKNVAKIARCIITTFDEGGQCGINGACEYEEYGYSKVAWWRTPSWIDVNTELMNRYYTQSSVLSDQNKHELAEMRAAHNFWCVYAKPSIENEVSANLKFFVAKESGLISNRHFDFESVLDTCGFHYMENIPTTPHTRLWEIKFE